MKQFLLVKGGPEVVLGLRPSEGNACPFGRETLMPRFRTPSKIEEAFTSLGQEFCSGGHLDRLI
jgi:hypothetical protein